MARARRPFSRDNLLNVGHHISYIVAHFVYRGTLRGKRGAAAKKPMALVPGDLLLDLLYVDDVIDAIMAVGAQLVDEGRTELTHYAIHSQQIIRLEDIVATFPGSSGWRRTFAGECARIATAR